MKKFLVLLLTAILCFSFCACGNKIQNNGMGTQSETLQNSEHDNSQTSNETNVQTGAVVIHIVINPEFKIHVDDDGNVICIECLNADAKSVNDKISVVGKSCEDALALIVKETVNQGFMKNGDEIKITVSMPKGLANQSDTWSDTVSNSVMHALTENNMRATIIFASDDYSKQIDTSNNSIETYFRSDGTIEKEIHTMSDGITIEMTYDNIGILSSLSEQYPDGTKKEQVFFSDGTLQTEKYVNADGSRSENIYSEGGNILRAVWKNADGSVGGEKSYHANGVLAHEMQYDARGVHHENTYNEQGEILTENYITDSNIIKIVYSPAGVMKYKHFYEPDGSFSMTFLYDAAGNHVDILDENGVSIGQGLGGQGAGQ